MIMRMLLVFTVIVLTAFPASAQLDKIFKSLGGGEKSGLSDVKIGSGLKEALKVGTENAVNLTGKTDGYFLNQAIKILMPEKLKMDLAYIDHMSFWFDLKVMAITIQALLCRSEQRGDEENSLPPTP